MSLIPDEELAPKTSISFAPMVDFLFIIIAIFALVAISRKALYDSHITLVDERTPTSTSNHLKNNINLSISPKGEYKWLDQKESFILDNIETIKTELKKHAKPETQILLHIDKKAEWQPIAKLIYAMNEEGFNVYPIYEKK
jgi:biopolymer transport protein ExbD